ncbi:MAG: PAS domain-containing protein [Deltaproteobacteria bacterium]|nr:PAS domain-containing protein [Deltaproteobacteria bacterium]
MRLNDDTCNSGEAVSLPFAEKRNFPGYMEEPPIAPFWGNAPHLLSEVVLQNIGDPVVFIDHDFQILWANHASTKTEAIGKSCYEEFRRRREPCLRCPVEAMFGSGKAGVVEKWIPQPGSSGRWFEVRTYPISDQSGRVVCAFRICFDITNRRHALEKQKKYVETLEKTVEQTSHGIAQTRLELKNMANLHPRLSRREMEVLRLMTEGFTNPEISQTLSMSAHTVKSHVIHIFNKLDVSDRTQAAVQAIRLRIII